jgi:hypothetical protein
VVSNDTLGFFWFCFVVSKDTFLIELNENHSIGLIEQMVKHFNDHVVYIDFNHVNWMNHENFISQSHEIEENDEHVDEWLFQQVGHNLLVEF